MSGIFKQCVRYTDTIEVMTVSEMEASNTGDYAGIICALDCPFPTDQKVDCVYVMGITHDLRRFDGLVPNALLESWEEYRQK